MKIESFTTQEEDQLAETFLKQGYIIQDVDNKDALDTLRHAVVEIACQFLDIPVPNNEEEFLNTIHKKVGIDKINALRMTVFSKVNALSWFRPTYFALARSAAYSLIGNELAMQNKVNLSIQMPNDETSVLPVHADAWSEETPFQLVEWLPLVDVFDTKAMFILDPESNRSVTDRLATLSKGDGSKDLFEAYKDKFSWVSVPYGKVLLFSPNILHGNVVNFTPESRWSFNCRLTGLFTPYWGDDKKLGDFYLPITTKVVSRIGMNYRVPRGFDE
jgi:sporadic carbohydrate cluster 2OG-Fe(II) oxygenase